MFVDVWCIRVLLRVNDMLEIYNTKRKHSQQAAKRTYIYFLLYSLMYNGIDTFKVICYE